MDQPGKVANPARGQLNREISIPLSPCVPENLVSRDGFSRPVPRQPAHLHPQAESGAYLRDSSRVPQNRCLIVSEAGMATERPRRRMSPNDVNRGVECIVGALHTVPASAPFPEAFPIPTLVVNLMDTQVGNHQHHDES